MTWQRGVYFLLVFLLIVGSAKSHISGSDSEARFWFLHRAMTGQEDTQFQTRKYSSSMAWVGLPLYAVGWATLGGKTGTEAVKHLKTIVANTNHLLLFGFSIYLFYWMRRRLGFSGRQAALGVLGVLIASMAIPDSEDFYSEILSSSAAFYMLDQIACAFMPGAGCAYKPYKLLLSIAVTIWCNPVFAPVTALTVAAVFLLTLRGTAQHDRTHHGRNASALGTLWRSLFRSEVLSAAAGIALGVAVYLLENHLKFGSMWLNGYEDERNFTFVPINYLNILVAVGKGVLWYAPGLLLGPWVLWRMRSQKLFSPSLNLWIAAWYCFFAGMLAIYGSAYNWGAFRFWGPRYMLSVTVFCAILMILLIQQRKLLPIGLKWAVYASFGYSILVNWIGETIGQRYYGECVPQTEACSTAWSTSPLYVFSKPVSEWLLLVQHRYMAASLIVGIGMLVLYRWLAPGEDRSIVR